MDHVARFAYLDRFHSHVPHKLQYVGISATYTRASGAHLTIIITTTHYYYHYISTIYNIIFSSNLIGQPESW